MGSRVLAVTILALAVTGAAPQPSSAKTVAARAGPKGTIPSFNFEESCRAAMSAGLSLQSRTESACAQDEKAAQASVQKEWNEFSASQKSLCLNLEHAGGMPSYVEFLTCLEMGKAAAGLPNDTGKQNTGAIEKGRSRATNSHRRRPETTGAGRSR